MKILFRLGLLWLESILACQIPTYLLSRCHYYFTSHNADTILNQTGGPYLFLHLLSSSFACVGCFGQETCGGLGSFLWSWRFYSKRGQFYLCLINSSFLYLRELTDNNWDIVAFAGSWCLWKSMGVAKGKHKMPSCDMPLAHYIEI